MTAGGWLTGLAERARTAPRRAVLYAALLLLAPIPALAGTGGGGEASLGVQASLSGCAARSSGVVCTISAGFNRIPDADYYTARVIAPNGSVRDFGVIGGGGGGGGSATLQVPYSGSGTYTVVISAWAREDPEDEPEVIEEDDSEAEEEKDEKADKQDDEEEGSETDSGGDSGQESREQKDPSTGGDTSGDGSGGGPETSGGNDAPPAPETTTEPPAEPESDPQAAGTGSSTSTVAEQPEG